jgi:tight adherence protein C
VFPLKTALFTLTFLAALMFGGLVGALLRGRKSLLDRRLGTETEVNVIEEAAWARLRKWNNPLFGIAGRLARQGGETDNLRAKIRAAGFEDRLTVETFISLKLLIGLGCFALLTALGVFGLGLTALSMGLLVGALGYVAPEIWLTSLVTTRRRSIEKGLLNMVTMLAMTCEAGLSLTEALARVAHELGGQIGAELDRILTEIKMGVLRSKALKDAAERYDSADLSLVLGAIATADEHGTPIVEVLKEVARQLRQARRTRAQEQAQKASVKILIPIILCMFLPLAVVLVGPPIVNLVQSLSM